MPKRNSQNVSDSISSDIVRLQELQGLLTEASYAYYAQDAPMLEDAVYDQLYRELLQLEQQYPDQVMPASPTQRVGEQPSEGFNPIEHRIALYLSLIHI